MALQVVEVALDCIDGYVAARAQDLRSISIGRRAERLADVEQNTGAGSLCGSAPADTRSSHFVFAITAAQANHVKPDGAGQIDDALGCPIGIAMRAEGRHLARQSRTTPQRCGDPDTGTSARCVHRGRSATSSSRDVASGHRTPAPASSWVQIPCTCFGRPARCPPMGVGSIAARAPTVGASTSCAWGRRPFSTLRSVLSEILRAAPAPHETGLQPCGAAPDRRPRLAARPCCDSQAR